MLAFFYSKKGQDPRTALSSLKVGSKGNTRQFCFMLASFLRLRTDMARVDSYSS
jgi:hypothetical protein